MSNLLREKQHTLTEDQLDPFREVTEELRSVYTLAYYPKNQEFDGAWRPVEVRVNKPGVTVRTRQGYAARQELSFTQPLRDPTAGNQPACLTSGAEEICAPDYRASAPSSYSDGSMGSL